MLKVGIIGAGKIADSHLIQLGRISGCQLAGVCDTELLMARQAAIRYRCNAFFDDVNRFLDSVHPDVVHITTPPQSHYDLAMKCLRAGCHVYIEKPFAINFQQTDEILRFAEQSGLKVTVGHNAQFSPAMNRMREMVKAGYLGGDPVHMESYYCYNIDNSEYAQSLVGNKNHWVRQLPGGLIQNVFSHGIAKIAEFMDTDDPEVAVLSYTSPVFKSLGDETIVDELRVSIYDRKNTTAYLTFSTQIKPAALHQFRIYGKTNGVFVDHNTQVVYGMKDVSYKSYLNYLIPQINMARQYVGNFFRNFRGILRKQVYMDYGMYYLVKSFYEAIDNGVEIPVSYCQIRMTSLIMDRIMEQLPGGSDSDK